MPAAEIDRDTAYAILEERDRLADTVRRLLYTAALNIEALDTEDLVAVHTARAALDRNAQPRCPICGSVAERDVTAARPCIECLFPDAGDIAAHLDDLRYHKNF